MFNGSSKTKILRVISGIIICMIAALFFFLSAIAFIDPAGTKMSDDNDPFGPPPSRVFSAISCATSIVMGAGGVFLILPKSKNKKNIEQVTGSNVRLT